MLKLTNSVFLSLLKVNIYLAEWRNLCGKYWSQWGHDSNKRLHSGRYFIISCLIWKFYIEICCWYWILLAVKQRSKMAKSCEKSNYPHSLLFSLISPLFNTIVFEFSKKKWSVNLLMIRHQILRYNYFTVQQLKSLPLEIFSTLWK